MTTLTPRITLAGAELAGEKLSQLIEMRVDRSLGVPATVEIRMADPGYKLAATMALGKPLVVKTMLGVEVVTAEITSVTSEASAGQPPELHVVGHDKTHRMGRTVTVTTFQKQDVVAIIKKLASNHGLKPQVTITPPVKFEYLMQAESDLVLLDALTRRVGAVWWFDKGTLHVTNKPDATKPLELKPPQLVALSVRANGHQAAEVRVNGWKPDSAQPITAKLPAKGARVKPPTGKFAKRVSAGATKLGPSILRTSAAAVDEIPVAKEVAQGLAGNAVAAAVTVRGEAITLAAAGAAKPVDVLTLGVGGRVQVADMGDLSGAYHVSGVQHVYRPNTGLRTRFTAGPRVPIGLVDLLGPRDQISSPFRHMGLMVGEVTNNNDPLKRGRVRVRFLGLDMQNESGWARLMSLGGGKDRGVVFLPEVGDEVLVGFEEGDVHHPVILGGLFGHTMKLPKWKGQDPGTNKVVGRHLTSRLGHVIEFRDGITPAEQAIRLALQGEQHELVLAKDRVELTVPAMVPVTVKAGMTTIKIAANGDLSMDAPNITLKALQNLTLEAMNIAIKSLAATDIAATGPLTEKGSMVTVQGSGPVAISGATVAIN